ncbi:MAG TPA: hypothetical protein VLV85_10115 [Stellaceae bacterium]|jgi:hypothetical protein|nr:hypothetical protein [Stellaceae bacterium]
MAVNSRALGFASLTALSIVAALAVAPSAFAQSADKFQDGSSTAYRENVVRQSAGSSQAAAQSSTFQDGTSTAYRERVVRDGAGTAAGAQDPRYASTVPMVNGKPDVVGTGGAQDDLAKQIYQPGGRLSGY